MGTVPRGNFRHVKEGDRVRRMLAGVVPMDLRVSEVTDDLIWCACPPPYNNQPLKEGGGWSFDRLTGAEVDDELQWGPKYGVSGSYLSEVLDGTEDPDS